MFVVGFSSLGERAADADEQQRPRPRTRRRRSTNAVSRPNTVETTPPTAAPTASIVPHSEPAIAFAVARSSGSTTLGIAADDAGSNGRAEQRPAPPAAGRPARRCPARRAGTRGRRRTRARSHTIIEPAAVDPVGQHAGRGRRQEERQLLRHDREPDVDRAAGGLQDQAGDGHEEEPVAAQRDHRRQEQPPEVPVAPEQRQAGAEARLGGGFSVRYALGVGRSHGRSVRLAVDATRGGRHARAHHVVPSVGVAVARRRTNDLRRPVGNARRCALRRLDPRHARARRSLPAGRDRTAAHARHPDRRAARRGRGAGRGRHRGRSR